MALEKPIQDTILRWLMYQPGVFAWRQNTGAAKIRDASGQERFITFGLKGTPDIIACVRGAFYGIEIKAPKGKQTDHQKAFQERLEKAGGKYILARSLEDVEAALA